MMSYELNKIHGNTLLSNGGLTNDVVPPTKLPNELPIIGAILLGLCSIAGDQRGRSELENSDYSVGRGWKKLKSLRSL